MSRRRRPSTGPESTSTSSEAEAAGLRLGGEQPARALARGQDDSFVVIARALRPHGVGGEILCEIITEFPRRFRHTSEVYLAAGATGERVRFAVERARLVRGRGTQQVLLKLAGIEDRSAAEALRGLLVEVPRSAARKLPRGRFYWHDLIGLRAVTPRGEPLGEVVDILETGANDVYVVRCDRGEMLVPAIRQVVREIAPSRGEMVVEPLPGMEPTEPAAARRSPRARGRRRSHDSGALPVKQ